MINIKEKLADFYYACMRARMSIVKSYTMIRRFFRNIRKYRHFLAYDINHEFFHYTTFYIMRPKLKAYAEAIKANNTIIKYTPRQRRKIYRRAISVYNVLNDLIEGRTYEKCLPKKDMNRAEWYDVGHKLDESYLRYFWYMMSKYSERWGF